MQAINYKSGEVINNFAVTLKVPKKNNYNIYLKYTPEHTKNLIIDTKVSKKLRNELKEDLSYDQITYIDKTFFIFFQDRLKNHSYLNVIEQDESLSMKIQLEYYEMKSIV